MYTIAFLVVGVIVGWFASTIVKGHGLGGFADVMVGVIGALLGGFMFDILGITSYGFWGSFVTAIAGAVVLLLVVDLFLRYPKVKSSNN